jgi:stalled ribosome alternative rescue factor ArfA
MNKKKMKKRNPYWKWLRKLKHKVVVAKRGKGSYTRKLKHRKGELA